MVHSLIWVLFAGSLRAMGAVSIGYLGLRLCCKIWLLFCCSFWLFGIDFSYLLSVGWFGFGLVGLRLVVVGFSVAGGWAVW